MITFPITNNHSSVAPAAATRSVVFTRANSERIEIVGSGAGVLNITQNITLAAFVKTTAQEFHYVVAKITGTDNQRHYYMQMTNDGGVRGKFYKTGNGVDNKGFLSTTTALDDGEFHLIIVTYSSSDVIKLYIDGVDSTFSDFSAGTTNGTMVSSTAPVVIGSNSSVGGGGHFDGSLAWVGIWNDVLTQAEVTELYAGGSPISPTSDFNNYVSSSLLRGHWEFNSGDSLTTSDGVIDQSGNSQHGTGINLVAGDLVEDYPS